MSSQPVPKTLKRAWVIQASAKRPVISSSATTAVVGTTRPVAATKPDPSGLRNTCWRVSAMPPAERAAHGRALGRSGFPAITR